MPIIIQNVHGCYISNLVKAKLQKKLNNGEICGPAPIGYLNKPKTGKNQQSKVIIDRRYMYGIKSAFRLYSMGYFSIRQVMDALNEHKAFKEKPLSRNRVVSMLKNPFYCGYMMVNDKQYPHKYKKIISVEVFEKCQSVMKNKPNTKWRVNQ